MWNFYSTAYTMCEAKVLCNSDFSSGKNESHPCIQQSRLQSYSIKSICIVFEVFENSLIPWLIRSNILISFFLLIKFENQNQQFMIGNNRFDSVVMCARKSWSSVGKNFYFVFAKMSMSMSLSICVFVNVYTIY